jgi:hypothetical protein
MMGILVPETRWASNKICNKKSSHLVGILFPHNRLLHVSSLNVFSLFHTVPQTSLLLSYVSSFNKQDGATPRQAIDFRSPSLIQQRDQRHGTVDRKQDTRTPLWSI